AAGRGAGLRPRRHPGRRADRARGAHVSGRSAAARADHEPRANHEHSQVRVAAVGDVHLDEDVVGRYRPALEQLPEHADVLLLAGDLTRHGTVAEARCVATEFGGLGVPVIAVLGNHDYHAEQPAEVTAVLEDVGITVLEGAGTIVTIDGTRLGVA